MKIEGVETEIILYSVLTLYHVIVASHKTKLYVWNHNGISIHDANDTRVNPLQISYQSPGPGCLKAN